MVLSKKPILKSSIWLSVIGILLSLYMVYNHYRPSAEGSFCDFGKGVNCTLVNASKYATFLGVPVSFLGVLWFLVLLFIAWKCLSSDGYFVTALTIWSGFGFLFIIYMVIAEILLKTFCLFCTLLHIFILYIFIASCWLYKKEEKVSLSLLIKESMLLIIFIALLFGIPIIIFNFFG